MNTVFVHKLKQEGIEIALLVSHWLIFLTNQQTKVLGGFCPDTSCMNGSDRLCGNVR